jgi:hypothetical protein
MAMLATDRNGKGYLVEGVSKTGVKVYLARKYGVDLGPFNIINPEVTMDQARELRETQGIELEIVKFEDPLAAFHREVRESMEKKRRKK